MLTPATSDAPVFGLVLCGGQSRRMGQDKARLELAGKSLLERAIATLEPLCAEVWLASGATPRYFDLGRLEVLDRRRDSGPLAGLEAGLFAARARAPRSWLALIACDMPAVPSQVYRELVARAEREGLDVCGLASPDGPEPMACVYSSDCLESVSAALAAGERKMTNFARFAARHGAVPLIAWQQRASAEITRNLNTPEELGAARA